MPKGSQIDIIPPIDRIISIPVAIGIIGMIVAKGNCRPVKSSYPGSIIIIIGVIFIIQVVVIDDQILPPVRRIPVDGFIGVVFVCYSLSIRGHITGKTED
jgi:hypothetical protein